MRMEGTSNIALGGVELEQEGCLPISSHMSTYKHTEREREHCYQLLLWLWGSLSSTRMLTSIADCELAAGAEAHRGAPVL